MSPSTTYLLNSALHAAVLSVFAGLILLALRQARHRSVAAIAGLLAVGFLPWLTALRPPQPVIAPVPEIQTLEAPALPTWTVMTLPTQQKSIPLPTEPTVAPTKFVFPDPPTTFATVWATGSGLGLLLLTIASLKVRIWRKSLLPLDDTAWRTLELLHPEIPARHHFRLSETTASPCVTGFFRPRIVLPRFLLEPGSEIGLRWAVRHEIAHWQADDSRWMILFALIRCANWWNPLVHRLVSKWSDAREQLCDLHATGVSENRADYGEFLIAMASNVSKQPPLAVAMATRPHAARLKRRIVSLLGATVDSEKPVGKGFITISSALLLSFAVVISSIRISAEESDAGIDTLSEIAREPVGDSGINEVPAAPPPAEHPAEIPPPAAPPNEKNKDPINTTQIKITTKFMVADSTIVFADGSRFPFGPFFSEHQTQSIFSQQQILVIQKGLAQARGGALVTAPSITMRSSQEGTIEFHWELPGSTEQLAKRVPKSSLPFVGVAVTILPRFNGELPPHQPLPNSPAELILPNEVAEIEQTVDYRYIPGIYQPAINPNTEPPEGTNPDLIKTIKRTVNVRLPSGRTVSTSMGEIEPGRFLTVLTRADAIDSTGRPLDSFKDGKLVETQSNPEEVADFNDGRSFRGEMMERVEESMKNARGRLRLNAVVIDLPRDPQLPEDQRYFKKLYPTVDDSLDSLVKHHHLEKRKLKQVEIPLNERRMPWPEFPGIKLSATTSKDLKLIALSNDSEKNGASLVSPLSTDGVVHIDVQSGNPAIERRLYITVEAVK